MSTLSMFAQKHLSYSASFTVLPCFVASLLFALPHMVSAASITSTVIADAGSSASEVEDSQTNTFLPLSAMTTHVGASGTVTNSSVNASFTTEDLFQVNVDNDWDTRGSDTGGTIGFGTHFEYEFVAEGSQILVTTSNFVEQPLFPGAITRGANFFRWRIHDLTTPNGFVVIDFDGNGTLPLPLTVGHDYLLQLSDLSAAAGGTFGFGLLHSATFDVSVPALFASGDFNEDGVVDATDYTVWSDNLGSGTALPNDNGLGTPIGQSHYNLWVENFGPAASVATAIPEPTSLLLVVMAISIGYTSSQRSSATRFATVHSSKQKPLMNADPR